MADWEIVQERDGDFTGPRQALVCGVRVTFYEPNIDKDFEKDLRRFKTREDDVFIVTYPKSGEVFNNTTCHWNWKFYLPALHAKFDSRGLIFYVKGAPRSPVKAFTGSQDGEGSLRNLRRSFKSGGIYAVAYLHVTCHFWGNLFEERDRFLVWSLLEIHLKIRIMAKLAQSFSSCSVLWFSSQGNQFKPTSFLWSPGKILLRSSFVLIYEVCLKSVLRNPE